MDPRGAVTFIEAKRDGKELPADVIVDLIHSFRDGRLSEPQMAALLMAICWRGMSLIETQALTRAIRSSGTTLRFPPDPRPLVDRHSTGGVGDKGTLVLAPLLASLGFRVPIITARSITSLGGTLDKVEAIAGFKTDLTPTQIIEKVQTVGCVICGPTADLVPVDRQLLALRGLTGTMPCPSLIASSILAKKSVESLDALVVDVKVGCGALMRTQEQARALAQLVDELSVGLGIRTRCLLTRMDAPVGHAVGNWLEVKEAVACLNGQGPEDLRELVAETAAGLLVITGKAHGLAEGRKKAKAQLSSGEPIEKWTQMLAAQGADLAEYRAKLAQPHTARCVMNLESSEVGFVHECDARVIGEIVGWLSNARFELDSVPDHDVGIDQLAAPGTKIRPGDVLARIHAQSFEVAAATAQRLRSAFVVRPQPCHPPSRIFWEPAGKSIP
jgi:pyrimidine-nucleoside phosphorylase